jgi:hypothetical protein
MLSTGNLRKNHKYRFQNYGEESLFVVLDFVSETNYIIQLVESLEIMEFKTLVDFGLDPNYQLHEIEINI